ncbi:N-acetylmuramoyl-L-alanine amidase family protein [Brevibacillus sp. H7]|uniref:N-acetylmuramoyl-L-alanine amidase family protein n=1 Tax=Brevibacillus sp. H7 TaxID=3349138 RepID=UPI00381D4FA4
MMKKITVFVLFAMTAVFPAAASVPLTPVQILIDVGHGGVDSGTSYHDLFEKEINLQIAKRLYRRLSEAGYRVMLNRDRDQALSDDNQWLNNPSRHKRDLAQRKHLAKELSPQMMISLHVNWSSDQQRRGPVILYQANNQSFLLADLLQHSLNQVFGTRDEPVQGRSYYLLKHEYCPTVIVEMGFISNTRDRAFLTGPAGQKKIAQAIADAVSEYLLIAGDLQQNSSEETLLNKLRRFFHQ